MARKKKTYMICNPKASFMFGCYITGWYCGDGRGNPEFSEDFSLYSNVKVYPTKKEALEDLNRIIDRYPTAFIVEGDGNRENG